MKTYSFTASVFALTFLILATCAITHAAPTMSWSDLLSEPGILNPDRTNPHTYIVSISKPDISAYSGVSFTESPYVGWDVMPAGEDVYPAVFFLYEGAPQEQNTSASTFFNTAWNPTELPLSNQDVLKYSEMDNLPAARWYYFKKDGVQEFYVSVDTDTTYIIGQTTSLHPNGSYEALLVSVDADTGQFQYAFGYQDLNDEDNYIFDDGGLTTSGWVYSAKLDTSDNTLIVSLKGSGSPVVTSTMILGLNRKYLKTLLYREL